MSHVGLFLEDHSGKGWIMGRGLERWALIVNGVYMVSVTQYIILWALTRSTLARDWIISFVISQLCEKLVATPIFVFLLSAVTPAILGRIFINDWTQAKEGIQAHVEGSQRNVRHRQMKMLV